MFFSRRKKLEHDVAHIAQRPVERYTVAVVDSMRNVMPRYVGSFDTEGQAVDYVESEAVRHPDFSPFFTKFFLWTGSPERRSQFVREVKLRRRDRDRLIREINLRRRDPWIREGKLRQR